MEWLNEIKFDEKGLAPAVAQDAKTREVLMLAYMNKEAVVKTIETKFVHYFSRSRNELWKKGQTSGCFQRLIDFRYDCDMDAVLVLVEQEGAACHTGNRSCFYRSAGVSNVGELNNADIIYRIENTINDRKASPKENSYTNYLLEKGSDKILKKVGEEAAEVIIATKNHDKNEIIYETADLIYHLSVNLSNEGVCWDDVFGELKRRNM